jgi:glycosyltransferase involved in cell wall biosynthesis
VALIGNALPRRCGIATFTSDLEMAIRHGPGIADSAIVALCEPGSAHRYGPEVACRIAQDDPASYAAAARFINAAGYDVVCLQHEFGIFGGEAGAMILGLVDALDMPLVTTFHTVLDQPTPVQRQVMARLIAASARLVVMAGKGREILRETYATPAWKIDVIPHGIPDVPLRPSAPAKDLLGYGGRPVVLTFGLISPNKGIEIMIEAMPAILRAAPDTVYLVMGATHPRLLAEAGEAYRETLVARVRALGLERHVVFLNQFVDRPRLLDHIAMCDVYVTPYLGAAQMTSGTLAYSHGLGRPVVATPYWHASELLSDGSGVLVPFADPLAMGAAVAALLTDEPARLAMGGKAYAASRATTWANTGKRFVRCLAAACCPATPATAPVMRLLVAPQIPAPAYTHFAAMCDDTGIFQHAIYAIPDRAHGYCIDDNARALLLCCALAGEPGAAAVTARADCFAAFIQHGWNPDNLRFRNFMGFTRQWLEPAGSQDSHGRTLWALGTAAATPGDPARARWAAGLFGAALGTVGAFTSPRAWAFTLLGLDGYCAAMPGDRAALAMRNDLAARLGLLLQAATQSGWVWFEDGLSYDNARLCQALIVTGAALGSDPLLHAGLDSLRWLVAMQSAPQGHFRPIGSAGFHQRGRAAPMLFDQQPIEACATVAACAAALASDPGGPWLGAARQAFAWFLGANDLALSLVDRETGRCGDGLHPDRANENCGAESVLAYLMALTTITRLEAAAKTGLTLRTGAYAHRPALAGLAR